MNSKNFNYITILSVLLIGNSLSASTKNLKTEITDPTVDTRLLHKRVQEIKEIYAKTEPLLRKANREIVSDESVKELIAYKKNIIEESIIILYQDSYSGSYNKNLDKYEIKTLKDAIKLRSKMHHTFSRQMRWKAQEKEIHRMKMQQERLRKERSKHTDYCNK